VSTASQSTSLADLCDYLSKHGGIPDQGFGKSGRNIFAGSAHEVTSEPFAIMRPYCLQDDTRCSYQHGSEGKPGG